MKRFLLLFILIAVTPTVLRADDPPTKKSLPAAAPGKMDFARDIWPIFKSHCLDCHKAGKSRGGLRLDDRNAALEGGNSGKVWMAGKPHKSRLLLLVAGHDPEVKMPPEGRKPLSAADIGRLRAWIEQGAKWTKSDVTSTKPDKSSHWAFQPIRSSKFPKVKQTKWVRNPIDLFVLAKLEKAGIKPSAPADRETLIRRLSFDLLGLPPSPREVKDFVNDTSPDAYLNLVNRMLSSPHYGERWGRHWLDLARYADSDGYEQDRPLPTPGNIVTG